MLSLDNANVARALDSREVLHDLGKSRNHVLHRPTDNGIAEGSHAIDAHLFRETRNAGVIAEVRNILESRANHEADHRIPELGIEE